jgi:hypothetical protein
VKKFASFAVFVAAGLPAFAETWTGDLVDAVCMMSDEVKDSSRPACPATAATHRFAIELPDSKILILNAAGNEKAANAAKNIRKTNPRAIVTGSLDGAMVRVESIEIQ